MTQQIKVDLRPWSESDYPLLERLMGDPEMTKYLEGPEAPEKLRKRHEVYCNITNSGKGRMFVIITGDEKIVVGSVGYWGTEWKEQPIWETGWSVLPEFQGQGIATKATLAVMAQAHAEEKHRWIHAFPSVENSASNAICRKAGFTFQKEVELEAWKEPGKFLRFNNWRFDLFADTEESTTLD